MSHVFPHKMLQFCTTFYGNCAYILKGKKCLRYFYLKKHFKIFFKILILIFVKYNDKYQYICQNLFFNIFNNSVQRNPF